MRISIHCRKLYEIFSHFESTPVHLVMHTAISSDHKIHQWGKWFKTSNFTWLVIQRQRGQVFLALTSRVEGGQCIGLTLDVAIFVFLGHFFLFSFRFFFFCSYFSLWLFSLYSHCSPFTTSRAFCDNVFLVYVVTGVLTRSPGSVYSYILPRTCFENLCQEASSANNQFLPEVKLPSLI